ncbi:BamA/TamA family outer membrane protein [Rhabdobacter roseus]|uniref:Bacterial surface antigen (D15) domain-containing protein n=1 Tax=Rhabdobacter roseus TaxID=1655419 RepID=A0A840TP23_9BACT|nr:BamA/TamA family outer membrane protein [Rhabdobacter roseus]MBB5283302.1 hypothetical protein [Rhabdobacter roseus]
MKIRLLLLFLLLGYHAVYEAHAQKSGIISYYWNRLVNDTTESSRPQFLIYPTLAYAPETSWEFGLSTLYVYYAKGDTANRLSEINGFTFFTLENQYGIWFDHALYTDESKWFFLGRFRFQSFPLLYHGLGPDSPREHQARVDANQLLIRERALRKVAGSLYLGVQVDFQRMSSVRFVPAEGATVVERPNGSEGSSNLGFGLGVVYDNRHNVLNVRRGIFSELALLRYAKAWGSDYAFTTVISDNRIFRPLPNSRDVIAAQLLGQFSFGDTPFNQMALLGGENIMRGYYLGRYRDNNMIATQVEYRLLPLEFSKRLGAAVFAGTGTVFRDFNSFSTRKWVWSGGAGLRFLLFPKKDIFTRFDAAFTREGPGFYLFIGEAF